jgi:hypothetical protein
MQKPLKPGSKTIPSSKLYYLIAVFFEVIKGHLPRDIDDIPR